MAVDDGEVGRAGLPQGPPAILTTSGQRRPDRAPSAPRAPQYDLNLADIAEAWRHGSATALKKSPELGAFAGHVSDSGEGRWTLQAAIDEGVAAPISSTALAQRFASRGEEGFANKVLSRGAVRVRRPRRGALTVSTSPFERGCACHHRHPGRRLARKHVGARQRHQNAETPQNTATISMIHTKSPPHPQEWWLNVAGPPAAAACAPRRRCRYLGYGGPHPR
jgi:hypothetical protein